MNGGHVTAGLASRGSSSPVLAPHGSLVPASRDSARQPESRQVVSSPAISRQSGHRTVSLVPSALVWARCGSAVTKWRGTAGPVSSRLGPSRRGISTHGSHVEAWRVFAGLANARPVKAVTNWPLVSGLLTPPQVTASRASHAESRQSPMVPSCRVAARHVASSQASSGVSTRLLSTHVASGRGSHGAATQVTSGTATSGSGNPSLNSETPPSGGAHSTQKDNSWQQRTEAPQLSRRKRY